MPANGKIRRVAVFGGSGFLGSEIASLLSAEGVSTRIAVRHPERVTLQAGENGTVETVYADVRDETSVELALKDCDAAINAVGLYVEQGAKTFEAVHELGALNLAHQCTTHKLKRLIHVSGIGAEMNSPSAYVRARAKGELLVQDVFAAATILRPSVLFGPQDKFINTFARMIRLCPALPLFGAGETKLQPVYVGDVARAVSNALKIPDSKGRIYELGGPAVFTYRQLMELVIAHMGKKRLLMPVPFVCWEALAGVLSILPTPPLTHDQIALVRQDNVVAKQALSLADLNVRPTKIEEILPKYSL